MNQEKDHAHVSPILVFGVLVAATVIEVTIALLGLPKPAVAPVLLGLSFIKASLVALYYMHLRYEKPIYGIAFVAPSLFAVFLIVILLTH